MFPVFPLRVSETKQASNGRSDCDGAEPPRRHVPESMAGSEIVSRDPNLACEEMATFGERIADRIVSFGGSWAFIILFAMVFMVWVALNSFVLMMRGAAFDPYPYILLNLALSTIAAFQAPIIMMSQNRQATKDRIAAAHAYEVNLKMEMEIDKLHEKIDAMRGEQLAGTSRHASSSSTFAERLS